MEDLGKNRAETHIAVPANLPKKNRKNLKNEDIRANDTCKNSKSIFLHSNSTTNKI